MTETEFAGAIEVLQVGKGKVLSPREIEVWYKFLADVPLEALQGGIARFVCEGDDFPSIAKIRRLAMSYVHGECLSWGEAYENLVAASRRWGFAESPLARGSLDSLTWLTVQSLGGWQVVCDVTTDLRSTFRAQFRNVYQELAERAVSRRNLPEALRPRITNSDYSALGDNPRRLPRIALRAQGDRLKGKT